MVRRFVAILTCFLMAHLTFVGGDFACANHPGDTAGMHRAHTHGGNAASNAGHAENDDAPCRTPSVPMCCQALQSCTLAVVVFDSQLTYPISSADDSTVASESAIPRSEITAPDPPPPRA